MPQPLPPSKPTVESLTVRDGDLEVTVSKAGVVIAQRGPRGGRGAEAEFTNVETVRLRKLLVVAEEHQKLLAEFLDRKP